MTARQGCPLGLQASWEGSGLLSWWGAQIIFFSLPFPPFLTSLPLTTSCPRAPQQIPAQNSSAFRPSGMAVKERYKSQAETKSVTSAKMIASKYVWKLLFTVTVVTVQEILPHFCLHWGRWAYSDSLAACQKLYSQLTYFMWICSTVGGKRLFGIMINSLGINHSLVCRPFQSFIQYVPFFLPLFQVYNCKYLLLSDGSLILCLWAVS